MGIITERYPLDLPDGRTIEMRNESWISDGNLYVSLTQGQTGIFDIADVNLISKSRWYANWDESMKAFSVRSKQGKAHRMLTHVEPGIYVDHVNRNPLDNRRANLRIATSEQNARNKALRSDNKSGYKGVSWRARGKKWHAYIYADQHQIHLGFFSTPEQAARAYDTAALELYGSFAVTNESLGLYTEETAG